MMKFLLSILESFWSALAYIAIFFVIYPFLQTDTQKKKFKIILIAVFLLHFITLIFKSCQKECSFDCNKIDSLRTQIQISRNMYSDTIKTLSTQLTSTPQNSYEVKFQIKEKLRKLELEKIATYDIITIQLNELSKNCNGCLESKQKFDSLTIKLNQIQ